MSTTITTDTITTSSSRHESAKQWLQRRLRKQPSMHPKNDGGESRLRRRSSVQRPQTAPSSETAMGASTIPALPPMPVSTEQEPYRPRMQPLPRPPRPNSGVMRNVNAWLEGSTSTPSPPLMAGVPYWRKATVPNARNTAGMQHAVPIPGQPAGGRPSTSHSQRVQSIRRRARKIQVQMPLLSRGKSQRTAAQKQVNRRSNSMPVLANPYEQAVPTASTMLLTRSRSILRPTSESLAPAPSGQMDVEASTSDLSLEQSRSQHGNPTSARNSETEGSLERRMIAIFGRSTRSADSTRPSTAAAHLSREDSMGDLSDAPTYFTGLPAPSYKSRTASIITTSSFGCIDGMTPVQRQMSQQQAALRRGMKGKLRRFAQNFAA